jgi:hypothetical protein
MELLLNLLWIVVACGLTAFLLRHRRTIVSGYSWGAVLGAALLIAVLLFPAISASDDLHSDLFLFEDASRRTLSILSTHPDLVPTVALFLPLRSGSPLGGLVHTAQAVESSPSILQPSSCSPASGLRAPPSAVSLYR